MIIKSLPELIELGIVTSATGAGLVILGGVAIAA